MCVIFLMIREHHIMNPEASKTREGRKMKGVTFTVTVPAAVKKKGKLWISLCPCLDVTSQGNTATEARKNLKEAVQLFLVSCYERGVLDEALKQCGFKARSTLGPDKMQRGETITVPLYMSAACAALR